MYVYMYMYVYIYVYSIYIKCALCGTSNIIVLYRKIERLVYMYVLVYVQGRPCTYITVSVQITYCVYIHFCYSPYSCYSSQLQFSPDPGLIQSVTTITCRSTLELFLIGGVGTQRERNMKNTPLYMYVYLTGFVFLHIHVFIYLFIFLPPSKVATDSIFAQFDSVTIACRHIIK